MLIDSNPHDKLEIEALLDLAGVEPPSDHIEERYLLIEFAANLCLL